MSGKRLALALLVLAAADDQELQALSPSFLWLLRDTYLTLDAGMVRWACACRHDAWGVCVQLRAWCALLVCTQA